METTWRPRAVVCELAPDRLLATLTSSTEVGTPVSVQYDPHLHQDRERLEEAVRRCQALIVRNQTRVDARLLQKARELRVIGRLGKGLDRIDVNAARERGIHVVYAPWANSEAVAEFTLGLILSLVRNLPRHFQACRGGAWDRSDWPRGMTGRTVGILGFGAVARHLARLLQPFRTHVLTYHPRRSPDHPDLTTVGAVWVEENELLQRSDILSVHLPLTENTRGYLNEHRLSQLPPGALVVNTSRGEVLSEAALVKLLMAGQLGGAALDVRQQEPPPFPDSLAAMDNVLLTPHIAGLTQEAQEETARQVALDVRRVLAGLPPARPA